MRSKVHPQYKTKYRVGNWSAYEQALVQRGDVTLWLSADATDAWRPSPSGRPGAPKASPQWAPQGKATVLDVRPTESPLTCLPRSGLSSAHVSSRTRAFNRNKSPHVSRLRGRRSQRRGEVGSWDVSVVDAHQDRSSPKWPRAGRSLFFEGNTGGVDSVADKVEVQITVLPEPTRGLLCLYKVPHKLLLLR